MALALPGAFSVFIPELIGYAVGFVANPARFPYNRYAQRVTTALEGSGADGGPNGMGGRKIRPAGLYKSFDSASLVRLQGNANAASGAGSDLYAWPRGNDRPSNHFNIPFEDKEYRTKRQSYDCQLDRDTLQNADWPVLAMYNRGLYTQCGINRAFALQNVLQTSSNWPATNTATANVLNGGAGKWSTATASGGNADPNFLAIKKTLDRISLLIHLYTNTVLEPGDLNLILTPGDAIAIANTDEIQHYFKNNNLALLQARGLAPGQNSLWGLPDQLYGYNVIVENTVRTAAGLTTVASVLQPGVQSFLWQDGTAVVTAKEKVEPIAGMPNFSTVATFIAEDMTSELYPSEEHRYVKSYVTDDFQALLTSPLSGFNIQQIT